MLAGAKLYLEVTGVSGLLLGTAGTYLGFNRIMTVKPPGTDHPVSMRVPSTDVVTFRQIFMDGEYEFDVVESPRTIVDAGANVGFASIYLACRFPGARILALEPDKRNFELLSTNVAPYENVHPLNAALWNEDTEINLVDPGLGDSGFVTRDSDWQESETELERHKVDAFTVSSLMEKFDIEKIDILKVDIEGAELEVFANTEQWIDGVDAVIIELHERLKAGCTETFESATAKFQHQWSRGENLFRARQRSCLLTPSS